MNTPENATPSTSDTDEDLDSVDGRRADLAVWGEGVGEEGRKTFQRFLRDGFFRRYMSGDHILDIGYKGYVQDAHPILPQAIGVDLDYPGYDGKVLPFADESQDAVFNSHTLEHIADYRGALRDWFRVLKVGGHLIIVVPHQFLYERRREPPSRWNGDHRRFYTAGSLLREIEEALEPTAFRVRMLEDNDLDYDYGRPLDQHPSGSYEIICVLEKIAQPTWAAELFPQPQPNRVQAFRAQPTPESGQDEPTAVIRSTPAKVDRLLLMKLDHRGDFTLAGPAFETIRRDFATAHITLLCGSWNLADAVARQLFDDVIAFDYFAESAQQAARPFTTDREAAAALRACLAGRQFDLAIDLRMDPDTRHLLRAVEAGQRAGFATPNGLKYLDIAAAIPQATGASRAINLYFGAPRFFSSLGENRGYAIDMPAQTSPTPRSCMIYGPHAPLSAGRYTAQLLIESRGQPFRVAFDVSSDHGEYVHRIGEVDTTASAATDPISFTLSRPVEDIEFRVNTADSADLPAFRFFGCSVRREREHSGVHQSEAMLVLAGLAFARSSLVRRQTPLKPRK